MSLSAPSRPLSQPAVDPAAIINALSEAVALIDAEGCIRYLNDAGEEMFGAGASILHGKPISALVASDSPLFSVLDQARQTGASVSETGMRLENPRIGSHLVDVRATALAAQPGWVVVALQERGLAAQLDRQLIHRNAARSVTAMAAMLAHEVKNPLSGIRGAAQLLEQNASADDRELTRLIIDETDRIVALVNRMEAFGDARAPERDAVNIHEVLDHVRRLAQSGFARAVHFSDDYDPSLPPVHANRDQLVQVVLNLVKNAAEAVGEEGGKIHLATSYRNGLRMTLPGGGRVELPLVVVVRDNGPGIAEDILPHLFDPFVTTKINGSGLGLAMVAKIIDDHGGMVDVDSRLRRTEFSIMLPVMI